MWRGGRQRSAERRARRIKIGAGEKSRTPDLRITNALLYQLSYTGVFSDRGMTPRENRHSSRSKSCLYLSSNAGSLRATGTFFSVTYCGSPFLNFG